MKKKFIASGILAASIASSIGQSSVLAKKSFWSRATRQIRNCWNKGKVKLAGTMAAIGAVVAKKKIFDVKEIRKVKVGDKTSDVVGMAQDCSHMFLSMSEKEFNDSIKRAEFYQLYAAYKVGYKGMVPTGERTKNKYKRILYKELDRRLNNGEIRAWLDDRWEGVNLNEPKDKLIDYIRRLIRFDPLKGDKGVPIFLAIGSGGSGKSYGFELLHKLLSGLDDGGDSLNLVNADEKAVHTMLSGSPPSFQNSGTMPKIIGKSVNVNTRHFPVLMDELDKAKPETASGFLQPINDAKLPWDFDGKYYTIFFGMYIAVNFGDHSFIEGLESYASKFGVDEYERAKNKYVKDWLLNAYFKDASKHFGEAFMTRVGDSIAIFRAPRRAEAKDYIDRKIKKTQGSNITANYFIDSSLTERQHDKVLDLIFNKLKNKSVVPKLSFRELSFGLLPALDRITLEQNGGIDTAGKQVILGLDETGKELRAEVVFGQNRRPYRDY